MRKLCLSVLLVAVIAGSCSTAAQRQLNAIKDGVRAIAERDTACHRQIFNNPAYRSIAQRMPLGDQNASIAQLIEPSMATDEEAALVIAMHNEKARFREQSLAETVSVVPGIVPILTQGYNEYDLIIADLLLKKISWGEANRRIATAHQASGERMRAAAAQLVQELAASHQAELAQRQAAANAVSQWGYQQQMLWQNQQLINRPVITNCDHWGSSITCTSR